MSARLQTNMAIENARTQGYNHGVHGMQRAAAPGGTMTYTMTAIRVAYLEGYEGGVEARRLGQQQQPVQQQQAAQQQPQPAQQQPPRQNSGDQSGSVTPSYAGQMQGARGMAPDFRPNPAYPAAINQAWAREYLAGWQTGKAQYDAQRSGGRR